LRGQTDSHAQVFSQVAKNHFQGYAVHSLHIIG